MKYYLLLGALITCVASFAQVDTTQLKGLYDRCLDFSEDKIDSIHYYADYISKEANRLQYNRGNVLSLRLKGLYEDLSNNYEKAIEYYLQSLEAARFIHAPEYELAALSDLAIAYFAIRQTDKAKEFYLQAAQLSEADGKIHNLINTYNNLAVIYTQLKQYDTSHILLAKAIELGKPLAQKGYVSLSNTYNNLGNLYFKEKKYDDALPYFRKNLEEDTRTKNLHSIWVDKLNLADVYIEKRQFDSATKYAQEAMDLALMLESKSKEADSYSILAKLAEYRGNLPKAYECTKKWYSLDTAILHSDTYKTIAALQERFHASERETENKLLQARVERETIRTRSMKLIAGALAIIGALIAIGWVLKRNANRRLKATNDLIIQQNEKLSELNYEKNSLISIVSHDLNTPFATIQIWGQVLQNGGSQLTEEQQKAMARILQAGAYGEQLIRQILDVEREHIGNHKLKLEKFDLRNFTEEMAGNFKPLAEKKNIALHTEATGKKIYILSDRYLVSRICENLLSNAIKYTPHGRNVWITLGEDADNVILKVRDEGVGIEKEELPFLFSKYSKISSRPTDGEGSNGLGLSIVKRIVEELNGRISCESEVDRGSTFTVLLKK